MKITALCAPCFFILRRARPPPPPRRAAAANILIILFLNNQNINHMPYKIKFRNPEKEKYYKNLSALCRAENLDYNSVRYAIKEYTVYRHWDFSKYVRRFEFEKSQTNKPDK